MLFSDGKATYRGCSTRNNICEEPITNAAKPVCKWSHTSIEMCKQVPKLKRWRVIVLVILFGNWRILSDETQPFVLSWGVELWLPNINLFFIINISTKFIDRKLLYIPAKTVLCN